jgi:TIR domain
VLSNNSIEPFRNVATTLRVNAMATVYVSYKSSERAFVESVVSLLQPEHKILVDYLLRGGVPFQERSLDDLRTSDVVLVFVSQATQTSAFQNCEIGAARFCAKFLDNKTILPVRIDDDAHCETLDEYQYVEATHRDPARTAKEIADQIARLPSRVRLFISHAHLDQDLAKRLVDVITSHFDVPEGQLRCSSVPGYQLELGTMASEALRHELGSADGVIALITPNSLTADWVRFELGAAWAHARVAMPLLVGGLEDKDIPGPFRGVAGGQLSSEDTLDRLLVQLEKELAWRIRKDPAARSKQHELTEYADKKTFARDSLEQQLKSSFVARLSRIGDGQTRLLNYIAGKSGSGRLLSTDELTERFADLKSASVFYRLEQLRLLGFLQSTNIGEAGGKPVLGWSLSEAYRREVV